PHNYDYTNKNINMYLPPVLNRLYDKYQKPILQSEIGINWQNGANTARIDPTGITLRQAAWAGMMGGGAGGAMHWWWDSWVHPYNLYYQFKGAGSYAARLDLSGEDCQLLDKKDASFSDPALSVLGYRYSDRLYGYIYDQRWIHSNDKSAPMDNITFRLTLNHGDYRITYYHSITGEAIKTEDFTADGYCEFTLPDFHRDIAFIIKKR
ncbi:MAG: hypothetical protein WC958_06425, partial [Dehalococcoidales bacterium]